jgi:hypothetical protein
MNFVMLSAILLSVSILNIIMKSAVKLSVPFLSVIMLYVLNVIQLNVNILIE